MERRGGCAARWPRLKGVRGRALWYPTSASVLAAAASEGEREVTEGGCPNFSPPPLVGLVNPRSVKLEIPATSRGRALRSPPRGRHRGSSPRRPLAFLTPRVAGFGCHKKWKGRRDWERVTAVGLQPSRAGRMSVRLSIHSLVRSFVERITSFAALSLPRASRCERTARETTYTDYDVRTPTISLIDFEAAREGERERREDDFITPLYRAGRWKRTVK